MIRSFKDLTRYIITDIKQIEDHTIIFEFDEFLNNFSELQSYELTGTGDCCARAYISEIHGDLKGLIGNPILQASEEHNWEENNNPEHWFFYKLSTIKESVTIRWNYDCNGDSGHEGYRSDVEFRKVEKTKE